MHKFLLILNKLSQWSGEVIALLILPMIGIIVYRVIMRYGFHIPVDWGFEVSLFIFGIHFMLGGAYTLKVGSHVSVDLLPNRLPDRGKKLSQIIAGLVVIFVCCLLIWLGSQWAWKSTKIWERSIHQTDFNPPVWWFKWIVPISAALVGLQAFAEVITNIRKFFTSAKDR